MEVIKWENMCLIKSLTQAISACLLAMISVDAHMSSPGPLATHFQLRPPHVLLRASHGRPLSTQRGPDVLGEASPRDEEANAAMKGP